MGKTEIKITINNHSKILDDTEVTPWSIVGVDETEHMYHFKCIQYTRGVYDPITFNTVFRNTGMDTVYLERFSNGNPIIPYSTWRLYIIKPGGDEVDVNLTIKIIKSYQDLREHILSLLKSSQNAYTN